MSVRFAIEPLANAHKRADFTYGNDRIDAYFRETVSQDVKRKYATCFVAREIATHRVAGFYTLSSSNVPLNEVPEPLAKKLPRYPAVPAVLIGWLGRQGDYAGQGLGEALLFDAIKTVATAPIGAQARSSPTPWTTARRPSMRRSDSRLWSGGRAPSMCR